MSYQLLKRAAVPFAAVVCGALSASALEVSLELNGIAVKAKEPIGAVKFDYPRIFPDNQNSPAGPTAVTVSNHIALLTYACGVKGTLELKDGGELVLTTEQPAGSFKLSQNAVFSPKAFCGKVKWAVGDQPAKMYAEEKPGDAFLFRADGTRVTWTADGSEGFGIQLPFGYTELKDARPWGNLQQLQYTTFSHLPKELYRYKIFAADGSAVTRGQARVMSSDKDMYIPYPTVEANWPGKGVIRTFGWQEGIRKNYFKNREADENAIVWTGDSLTEGWKTLKTDFPKYKVANRGVGGDTSRGVLFRFPIEVLALNPQMVFICAGANDMTAHGNPADTLYNLEEMVKLAREYNPKMPVIFSTLPPSSNPQAPLKPNSRETVNAGIKALGEKYANVYVYDFSAACMDASGQQNLSLFGKDRLHVAGPGYVIWAKGLTEIINKALESKKTAGKPKSADIGKPIDLSKMKLIWQDEFDGATLDPKKWQAVPNQQRQSASLWKPSMVSVGDGVCTLKIEKTKDPQWRYVSGCIRTATSCGNPATHLFGYKYGYVEARCRLPKHVRADYWFAVWLMAGKLGGAEKHGDTRLFTEVDILETFHTSELGSQNHTLHWANYGKEHNAANVSSGYHLELLDGKFHTFGLLWTEEKYTYYIDGIAVAEDKAVGTGSNKDGKKQSQGTAREPAYIKLSVEAAPWAGPTGGWEKEMPESDDALIDYVRVYQFK